MGKNLEWLPFDKFKSHGLNGNMYELLNENLIIKMDELLFTDLVTDLDTELWKELQSALNIIRK